MIGNLFLPGHGVGFGFCFRHVDRVGDFLGLLFRVVGDDWIGFGPFLIFEGQHFLDARAGFVLVVNRRSRSRAFFVLIDHFLLGSRAIFLAVIDARALVLNSGVILVIHYV